MDLEQKAIERLKMASDMSIQYYGQPLICTYSGGKDSDVMLELFKRSGIPFEVHNSHTTVDAPQTVYHIRNKFKELELQGIKCTIEKPKMSMWQLIPHKLFPPTRLIRYCCSYLKESNCGDRMIATGVRWDESTQRSSRGTMEVIGATKKDKIILANDNSNERRIIEKCELKAKTVCNPIIDWKHSDIWDYINSEKIETNPLYECGFSRVGCIGCPMVNKSRYYEFAMFPTYERAYKRAFGEMLEQLNMRWKEKPPQWKDADEVFSWWMEDKTIPGQISIADWMGGLDETT